MPAKLSDFWTWFVEHEASLRTAPGGAAPDQIEAKLREIDPRLGCELSEPGERRELILTAWSQAPAFPIVRELAAAAPKEQLANWRITALKPARGFRFAINIDGLQVDATKLMFHALTSPQAPALLGLRIYVTGAPPTDERWSRILPLILETGLGEELAAQISNLQPAAGPPPDDQALRLDELPEFIEWFRSGGLNQKA